MHKFRLISAILLALPLIVFGGNYFLQLFELPGGDLSAGTELLQAMRDGGLMAAIAGSHVAVGLLLLVPTTRFPAALLQLPISLGMVAFHFTMMPAGLAVAGVLLLLNLCVLADPKRVSFLFAWK